MRVLALAWALSDHRWGGEPIGAYELARHLAAEGVEVDVVTPVAGIRSALPPGVRVHESGMDRLGNSGWNKARAWRMARGLAKRESFHAVHLMTQFTSFPVFARPFVMSGCWNVPGIRVPPAAGTPPAPPIRARAGDVAYAALVERALGWNLERTLREADCIVVRQSRGLPHFENRARRVRFIPFGVDPGTFRGEAATRPTVLYAGNLKPYKGVHVLVEAFARVLEELPEARLRIAGEGPEASALQARCSQLEIRDKVSFLGHVPRPELVGEHARASVFALPSLCESFGQVALEAMASGKPVVVTEGIAGAFDYLREGENGFMVPPGDAQALACRLVELLGNPQRAGAMGEAARKTAEQFSWARVAREHVRLYESLG